MNQYALVKKRLKEDVIQISLLRQTECGLKESCGGNCAGCVQQPQGELLATASDPIGVQPGERVAQLCIAPVYTAAFVPVQELGDTTRGAGGFGSTGK